MSRNQPTVKPSNPPNHQTTNQPTPSYHYDSRPGGAGEVVLSRETFRLATRFDVFRCMHFYYSGLGHYINILTLMAVVQASIFSLVIFAFVKASFRRCGRLLVRTHTSTLLRHWSSLNYLSCDSTYSLHFCVTSCYASDASNCMPPHCLAVCHLRVAVIDSDDPNQNIKGYDVIEPVQIEQLLQIGSLVILPYVGQLVQESGPVRALVTVLMQVVSGSLAFFVFKQQTTAYYFYDDITYGGARYIGTGERCPFNSALIYRSLLKHMPVCALACSLTSKLPYSSPAVRTDWR